MNCDDANANQQGAGVAAAAAAADVSYLFKNTTSAAGADREKQRREAVPRFVPSCRTEARRWLRVVAPRRDGVRANGGGKHTHARTHARTRIFVCSNCVMPT